MPTRRRAPLRVVLPAGLRPPRAVVRRSAGTWTLQTTLQRHGLGPVSGVDEAGRGACAGPLVVAACVLEPGTARRLDGLTDSKLLTASQRERYFDLITRWSTNHSVVIIPAAEVDRRGVHVANIEGMRRAVAGLAVPPGYVLTDGFAVRGLGRPALAVPKGDQIVACIAAASVLAKVVRDRIMVELDAGYPQYGFAQHKGYCTPTHDAALALHGPCAVHRRSFVNVRSAGASVTATGPAVVGGPGLGLGGAAAVEVPGPLVHNGTAASRVVRRSAGGGLEP